MWCAFSCKRNMMRTITDVERKSSITKEPSLLTALYLSYGAGKRNRTALCCLGSSHSTDELCPQFLEAR